MGRVRRPRPAGRPSGRCPASHGRRSPGDGRGRRRKARDRRFAHRPEGSTAEGPARPSQAACGSSRGRCRERVTTPQPPASRRSVRPPPGAIGARSYGRPCPGSHGAHGPHRARQAHETAGHTHQTDAPDRNSRQERQTDAAQRTRRTRRTPGDTWHRPGSATPHPAPAGPGTAPRPPGDPLRAALGAPSRYVRQAVRADRRPYRSPYRSPCSTALFAGIVRWPRCLATLMATCIGRLRWPCSTHVPRPRSRAPAIGVFDHLFLARLRERPVDRPVIDPAEPLRSGLVPPCAGRAPRLAFTIGLLDQPSRSALRRRARPAASRTQHQADRSGRQHQAHGISPAAPRPTAALPEFAGGVDRDRPRLTPPVAPGRFHLPPGARYPARTAAIPTPNRQYA